MIDDKTALIGVKLGHLAVERDRDAFLRGLADLCIQAVDAERCTVYVVDEVRRDIVSKLAQRASGEIRLPIGFGISGAVALTGETINVPDAYADPRFDSEVDMKSGFRTRNMLVVPVWASDGGRVIGVIQVLNKRGGTFERPDQMVLERIADAAARPLERLAPALS